MFFTFIFHCPCIFLLLILMTTLPGEKFIMLPVPKIYEYIGFVFFFYSNEHLPVHCHVKKGDKEIKVELKYINRKLHVKFIKVKGKTKFEGKNLDDIEWFIRKHHIRIVEKWTAYFIYGKKPNFEKIMTRK